MQCEKTVTIKFKDLECGETFTFCHFAVEVPSMKIQSPLGVGYVTLHDGWSCNPITIFDTNELNEQLVRPIKSRFIWE